ncbi:hypothetical protein [Thermogemmatispora onikobensis]|uniref:hypothetical protein n=1 Tax=Thermogemmatispora onikobensis TaxID=732234 RepID=UPI00085373AB|nr:hypothetical protein [Thermogemmatispora onikobensis]
MSATSHPPEVARLVSHRRCVERIRRAWPAFLERRRQRLAEQERYGGGHQSGAYAPSARRCSGDRPSAG